MKKKYLKGLPSDYHPTNRHTYNTSAATPAILAATMPLLFFVRTFFHDFNTEDITN